MDIRKILDIIAEAEKPLQEFMDTGGGGGSDDEMKQRVIEMYFEDGLRETEIAKLEGIPEVQVHNIIIEYLNGDRPMDGLDEAEKPLAKGMKVLSLAQFLQQSGVEPPKGEGVAEGAPELLKKEMPTHRHAEKLLAQNGVNKDDPDYHKHLANTIKHLRKFGNIDQINKQLDEAEKLGGVSARKLPPEEMRAYLDRITKKEKEKTDKYKLPYIHSSNIPIVGDDGQKYDLQKLAAAFSERPTKILKQNEKMQHSDGSSSQFYNVGLPALKGLAVDEDTGEFVVIDTCPGAGACKLVCYAMKGGYVQWKASSLGQTKLLNFLYNDPDGFMSMLEGEIAAYQAKNNKKNIKTIIRWHDAGDFFSPEYLQKAYDLAKKFKDVDFYAYTKLASVAQGEKPNNFKINFSMGALPSQEKQVDKRLTKHSEIVPKEVFNDALVKDKNGKWQYKNPAAQNVVKQRISKKYSLDPESILTYDEMMSLPRSPDKHKYNVIVKPGDGDDSANRGDVLGTYLLIH